jgi:chromosome segregation ATPase
VGHELEDTQDRINFMREHLRASRAELASGQARAAAAEAAAEAAHDARCLVSAAVSRLDADDATLCAEVEALNAREAALARALATGDARLEGFRAALQWSAAQLDTWSQAAAAQDEDALALEAYKRADEARAARGGGCAVRVARARKP